MSTLNTPGKTPGKTPRRTPGNTPGKTPGKASAENGFAKYLPFAIIIVVSILVGIVGFVIFNKVGKRATVYYGIVVTFGVLLYVVLTRLLGKKKTD